MAIRIGKEKVFDEAFELQQSVLSCFDGKIIDEYEEEARGVFCKFFSLPPIYGVAFSMPNPEDDIVAVFGERLEDKARELWIDRVSMLKKEIKEMESEWR